MKLNELLVFGFWCCLCSSGFAECYWQTSYSCDSLYVGTNCNDTDCEDVDVAGVVFLKCPALSWRRDVLDDDIPATIYIGTYLSEEVPDTAVDTMDAPRVKCFKKLKCDTTNVCLASLDGKCDNTTIEIPAGPYDDPIGRVITGDDCETFSDPF